MNDLPIAPPDTALARQAHDLVHASCAPHIVAHCERSFQFAALVAAAEGVDVDETRLANRGISIDVRGVGAEGLPQDLVRAVLDAWPRHGFPDAFSRTLIDEVRTNPSSVRSSWMECIAIAHVPSFEPADFLSTLHSSTTFA